VQQHCPCPLATATRGTETERRYGYGMQIKIWRRMSSDDSIAPNTVVLVVVAFVTNVAL
jgi:hypothetical protein